MVAAADALPKWAARAIDQLHQSDQRARRLAGDLTGDQLYWQPAPGVWSIGECLQHLLAANEVYLPPIARALEGRTPSPVQAITPGWFGRWFIRTAIEPSPRSRRSRAPRKITPPPAPDPAIVERFVRSNGDARDLVRRASPFDVNRIRFVNPFVPLVRFTVGTGIEIVWRHQNRHLLQAERVAALMRNAARS